MCFGHSSSSPENAKPIPSTHNAASPSQTTLKTNSKSSLPPRPRNSNLVAMYKYRKALSKFSPEERNAIDTQEYYRRMGEDYNRYGDTHGPGTAIVGTSAMM